MAGRGPGGQARLVGRGSPLVVSRRSQSQYCASNSDDQPDRKQHYLLPTKGAFLASDPERVGEHGYEDGKDSGRYQQDTRLSARHRDAERKQGRHRAAAPRALLQTAWGLSLR